MARSPLVLALEIDGAGSHPAAWRRSASPPDELLTPGHVRRVAEVAERSGFTLVTIDDGLLPPGEHPNPAGRLGAIERASYIAASTSVLSVAPVVATTYSEPFHVSSQIASLDHVAAGRSGWVVAAEPRAASVWGRAPITGDADIRREAADSVAVARALWDSWEDDAVIRDIATSRYLDRDRLHYIDFAGDTFSVKGPAIVPRPPQGQPVVLAPTGLVPPGLVDVALVGGADVGDARAVAAAAGTARTFVELEVALDADLDGGPTAAERLADLERHGPWATSGRLRHTGSAVGLAALLREIAGFADGVRIFPLVLDEDLAVLSRHVIPALVVDRTITRPVAGATLRTTLGLPRPENQFAGATR